MTDAARTPPLAPAALDLHAHFLPARYRASALAHGVDHPDGMPALPEWSVQDHIAMMDDVGIGAALLSLSSPGVAFLPAVDDGRERLDLVRAVNDDGSAAVAAHPTRLGLLASLPLPHIEASLGELDRAYDTLGVDGVALHTHYDEVYLGDPRLEPVMAALDERSAVVTIHPTSPCGWEQVSFGRARPMLEFPLDTTRAVVNLALSGVFGRYPHIRWVVPHSGAALAVLADRVHRLSSIVTAADEPEVDVLGELRRLHFDLAGVPLPRSLAALLGLVDTDRIVYGSDYPFTPGRLVRALASEIADTALLDGPARAAALRDNALRLFPRFA